VKSLLAKYRVSKTGILTDLEALNVDFLSISALTKCTNSLKLNFRGAETRKTAYFEAPDINFT